MQMTSVNSADDCIAKVEAWFQFNGGFASQIQKTALEERQRKTQYFMDWFKTYLDALGLSECSPDSHRVVWGSGQIRCGWKVQRNSVRNELVRSVVAAEADCVLHVVRPSPHSLVHATSLVEAAELRLAHVSCV